MAEKNIEEIPGWPVDDLYRAVYANNNNRDLRMFAIILFVVGGLLLLTGGLNLNSSNSSSAQQAPTWLFLGLLAVGGGVALVLQSKKPPKFVLLFRDSPQRIVWLYITQVSIRGAYSGSRKDLNICLDDRTSVVLRLSSQDGEPALARFAALVPQAAVGYSVENRTGFQRDPRSLLRPKGVRRGTGLPG
jgi:hypothetical protein